jgi:hypothetical protein
MHSLKSFFSHTLKQYMTCRAIDRPLSAFFVAPLALLVKSIRPQRAHSFPLLSLVALAARRGLLPLLVDVMMALRALEAIPLVRSVLLVIKEHVPGNVLEHDPERRLRRFHRVSGIADHPYQKKDPCKTVSYGLFFL